MIKKQTVFVLGAGASCPYGFPTATELREHISQSFVSELKQYVVADGQGDAGLPDLTREAEAFVSVFCHPMQQSSIDLFLSRNQEYSRIGKMAILFSILLAERQSRFGKNAPRRDMDWYTYLMDKMTKDLTKRADVGRFPRNNISFITFNYDRSLEHFLYDSLCASFSGVTHDDIARKLDAMAPSHVYGPLGVLDWQTSSPGVKKLVYGGDINLEDIDDLIRNLRVIKERSTYSNATREPDAWSPRKEFEFTVEEAEELFFLGFGYDDDNLDAIGLPGALRPAQRIYGTAMGRTQREIQEFTAKFVTGLSQSAKDASDRSGQVHIEDCDCLSLIRKFL